MYNGLQIEMQIRSVLQHAWATTVETMGTLTRQALKSSLGDENWLRVFSLMGTAIACREQAPCVPGTPTEIPDLMTELRDYANRVNALSRVRVIGYALRSLEEVNAADAHLFLLEMNSDGLKVTGFRANQQREAQARYTEVEEKIARDESGDAVLVSVDSIASLRRAYPNYFLDTGIFAELLDDALSDRLLGSECIGA